MKTLPVTLRIPLEHLRWIIEEAHCNHWLANYDASYAVGTLRVKLAKDAKASEYDVVPLHRTVTYKHLAAALGKLLSNDRLEGNSAAAAFLSGDADGPAKDAILQVAVFGKVVYA